MGKTLIEKIKMEKGQPLIGIVGATDPDKTYTQNIGVGVGFLIRRYFESHSGSMFTGGVNGVGVDVYTGVIRFCMEHKATPAISDKFFVVVPKYEDMLSSASLVGGLGVPRSIKKRELYDPPSAYSALARVIPDGALSVVRVGDRMDERRKYIAELADALVVVNGGNGTLDEVLKAMRLGKKIITTSYSGGIATTLAEIKRTGLDAKKIFNVESFERDLIYIADDPAGIVRTFNTIFHEE